MRGNLDEIQKEMKHYFYFHKCTLDVLVVSLCFTYG